MENLALTCSSAFPEVPGGIVKSLKDCSVRARLLIGALNAVIEKDSTSERIFVEKRMTMILKRFSREENGHQPLQ